MLYSLENSANSDKYISFCDFSGLIFLITIWNCFLLILQYYYYNTLLFTNIEKLVNTKAVMYVKNSKSLIKL